MPYTKPRKPTKLYTDWNHTRLSRKQAKQVEAYSKRSGIEVSELTRQALLLRIMLNPRLIFTLTRKPRAKKVVKNEIIEF